MIQKMLMGLQFPVMSWQGAYAPVCINTGRRKESFIVPYRNASVHRLYNPEGSQLTRSEIRNEMSELYLEFQGSFWEVTSVLSSYLKHSCATFRPTQGPQGGKY